MKVNPILRAKELRKTLINKDRVLVADFSDTLQGKDTAKVIDLMPNIKTGEYIFRSKVNVKNIDPLASKIYGKDFFDITKHSYAEIEKYINQSEFDFPLWFKNNLGFSMKRVLDYNPPLVFQVAGCNFHDGSDSGGCTYCFVDNESNDGKITLGKAWLGIDDTITSAIAAREKVKKIYGEGGTNLEMKVLRSSGGEPIIVLDWILNLWREVGKRNLHFVGQIDTNLSTGQLVDYFEQQGVFEPHILEKLSEHPIKVLVALKGVDEKNLQENVQSLATMGQQEYSIKKFLRAGIDIYPQMYNPDPKTLNAYLKRMDGVIENFSSKIRIGPLNLYGPTKKRLTFQAQGLGLDPEQFIKLKKEEWDNNYKRGCEILDSYLRKHQGYGYKEITRADVPLVIKK
jgi:hypothetical protein